MPQTPHERRQELAVALGVLDKTADFSGQLLQVLRELRGPLFPVREESVGLAQRGQTWCKKKNDLTETCGNTSLTGRFSDFFCFKNTTTIQ